MKWAWCPFILLYNVLDNVCMYMCVRVCVCVRTHYVTDGCYSFTFSEHGTVHELECYTHLSLEWVHTFVADTDEQRKKNKSWQTINHNYG